MKIQTYDRIMNICGNLFLAIFSAIICFVVSWLVMFGISYGIQWSLGISIPKSLLFLIPSLISLPISFILWAASVPVPEGCEVDLRDFWIRFGVLVSVRVEPNESLDDVEKWVDDNAHSLYRRIGYYFENGAKIHTFAFLSAKDATAFKLKWV